MKRKDISDLEVCKAVQAYQEALPPFDINNLFKLGAETPLFPYEALALKFNCDKKLAYSACERAEEHGLIDYGVSLRTGWLSDKGKELLTPPTNRLIK